MTYKYFKLVASHFFYSFMLLWFSSYVFATCTIVDTTTSGFGSTAMQDINSREVAGTLINCDSEYRIALNAGNYYTASRRLSDGKGHFINYSLWTDAAGTVPWGDNGLGATYPANPATYTGNGSEVFHPVYGSAFVAGTNYAGLYTDTIHVTVAYPPYTSNDVVETDLPLALTLNGICVLDTSGLSGFGAWPAGTADLHNIALGAISVTCTNAMTYAVGLNAGLHWETLQSNKRHLAKGANFIPYILWADANGSNEWGDAGLAAIDSSYTETHPALVRNNTGSGSSQNFFIWADATIQNAVSGIYEDIIIVTVAW